MKSASVSPSFTKKLMRNSLVFILVVSCICCGWYVYTTPFQIIQNPSRVVNQLLRTWGFEVKNVVIEDRHYTKLQDVQNFIHSDQTLLIFEILPQVLKEQLEQLPWVRSAIVRRLWPDHLNIRLIEYCPIAIWQRDQKLFLISDQGTLLDKCDPKKFLYLPIITGQSAPAEAPNLISTLNKFPVVKKRLTGAARISERRWDLVLDHTLVVQLPDQNFERELEYLTKLLNSGDLNQKKIISIDLRIPDRVYFYLNDQTMTTKHGIP